MPTTFQPLVTTFTIYNSDTQAVIGTASSFADAASKVATLAYEGINAHCGQS